MMRRLILDVRDDAIRLRCADGEGAITFLPGKFCSRRSRVIEPLRRTTFDRLHRFRERHRRRHNKKSVNVIGCPANLDGFESMIFRNALHVAPEFRLQIIGKTLPTIFCRKDYVHAIAGVCVRQGSSLRDLTSESIAHLKRWAKLDRPPGFFPSASGSLLVTTFRSSDDNHGIFVRFRHQPFIPSPVRNGEGGLAREA